MAFFIPTYDLFKYNCKNYLATDNFHPNSVGYQAISNRIVEDTEEYKNLFGYLRKYLGDLDKDIMRIRLEESVRRKKANVKDK